MKTCNSKRFKKKTILVLTALLTMFVQFSQAATTNVMIVGDSFMPPVVTINAGDTVTWVGLADMHNVTGLTTADLSDFCGSSLTSFDTESSCSHTFTAAGGFPYECTIHGTCCGMTGMVVVLAVQAPTPTVSITNPLPGAVFSAPANLKLGATAAVSAGSVTNVAFFAGNTSLGSAFASPFNVTGSSLAAGNYSLTAVATAAGILATSSVVNISVVSPAPLSNSVPVIAAQHFSFDYSASVGLTYVVQRSADLASWTSVSTNVASTGLVPFSDTAPLGGAAYYRVFLQPNP